MNDEENEDAAKEDEDAENKSVEASKKSKQEQEEDEEDSGVGNFYGARKKKSRTKILTKNMKADRDLFRIKLKSLERKLKDEEILNQKTFNFKQGHYVEYGNII